MREQKLSDGIYIIPDGCLTAVSVIQPIRSPDKFIPGRIVGYILKKGSPIDITAKASGGYSLKYLSDNS